MVTFLMPYKILEESITYTGLELGLVDEVEQEEVTGDQGEPMKVDKNPVPNVQMSLSFLFPEPGIDIIKCVHLNHL